MLETIGGSNDSGHFGRRILLIEIVFGFVVKGLMDFLRCGLAARALAADYIWPMDSSTATQIGVTIRQTVYLVNINDVRQCD